MTMSTLLRAETITECLNCFRRVDDCSRQTCATARAHSLSIHRSRPACSCTHGTASADLDLLDDELEMQRHSGAMRLGSVRRSYSVHTLMCIPSYALCDAQWFLVRARTHHTYRAGMHIVHDVITFTKTGVHCALS